MRRRLQIQLCSWIVEAAVTAPDPTVFASDLPQGESPPLELPHIEAPLSPALALRPTFAVELEDDPAAVAAALRNHLGATGLEVKWSQVPGSKGTESAAARPHCHALLSVPKAEQRLWSPWLYLDIHPHPQGTRATEVLCRFAPHPSVWTAFAFSYLVLSVGVLAGLVGGAAQLTLGRSPQAAWLIPACLVVAAVLFGLARAGQRLAAAQMQALRDQLHAALPHEESIL